MRIDFSWEFSENEQAAIAGRLGKPKVCDDDLRAFLKAAVRDAVGHAVVEHEAAVNDPSTNTGP
jgi:hypothetical protein